MEEDVTNLLLVGLSKAEFIAYSIWGLVGMLMSFGWSVVKVTTKKTTKWNWSRFWSGGKRLGLGILSVAVGVVFFEKVAGFMLASDTPIQLTAWGSLTIVGLGSDKVGRFLASFIPGKK